MRQQDQFDRQFLLRDSIEHRTTVRAGIEGNRFARFRVPYQKCVHPHVVERRVEHGQTINLARSRLIFVLGQIA